MKIVLESKIVISQGINVTINESDGQIKQECGETLLHCPICGENVGGKIRLQRHLTNKKCKGVVNTALADLKPLVPPKRVDETLVISDDSDDSEEPEYTTVKCETSLTENVGYEDFLFKNQSFPTCSSNKKKKLSKKN